MAIIFSKGDLWNGTGNGEEGHWPNCAGTAGWLHSASLRDEDTGTFYSFNQLFIHGHLWKNSW